MIIILSYDKEEGGYADNMLTSIPFLWAPTPESSSGADKAALLRLCREKRGEAERSGKPRSSQPCDGATARQSVNPARAAHAEFVAAMAGHPPRPIPLDADALDLEDRADHLNKVFNALSVYVAAIW